MKTKKMTPPFFVEYGDSITFHSKSDTVPGAEQIAWRPNSLDFRQTKALGERYILNLYLDWVFKKAPFVFDLPMQITHADGQGEPDFSVSENGRQYGLEIARASTWRDERALDELIKVGPGFCLEIDADLNGEDRNYDPEAEVLPVGSPFSSEPLLGLDLEHKWAKCTAYRISEKQKKLETNYSRFLPSCDLVLYSACSVMRLNSALKLLRIECSAPSESSPPPMIFQRLAIICENFAIFDPLDDKPQIFTSDRFPWNDPQAAKVFS
jgi:hypothetical protein